MSIGRTPLIKLSPKKTVEGFVGAFISTVLFSLLWGSYFMRFNYMICPVHDLGVSAWSNVQCVPNPVFVWKDWQIPTPLATVLSTTVCSRLTLFVPVLIVSSKASNANHFDLICALPSSSFVNVVFCVARSSFWRVLRIRLQTGFQYQRFRAQYSWTRWYDRSHGLPVC